jgi:hypothetical protein
MHIAAPFQMKIVTDIRDLFALLREHGLFCTGRSKRSPRIPNLQRSKPLLETGSLFTLRSPSDQLQVVAFRLDQQRVREGGIANG